MRLHFVDISLTHYFYLIFSGISDGLILSLMFVYISVLASLNLMLEVGIKYSTEDRWVGNLAIFLFMAAGNINKEDISPSPTGILYISSSLVLFIFSHMILYLVKKHYQR